MISGWVPALITASAKWHYAASLLFEMYSGHHHPGLLGARPWTGKPHPCERCDRATRREAVPDDWAPSPIHARPEYLLHASVAEIQSSPCGQCELIADGVMHFARLIRGPAPVAPEDVVVECRGLKNLDGDLDFDHEYAPRAGDDVDSRRKTAGRLPKQLEIAFHFRDRPTSTVSLQVAASHSTCFDLPKATLMCRLLILGVAASPEPQTLSSFQALA